MERWLTIKDFPNYEVSDKGKIKNSKTGRILKTRINEHGYEQVQLRKDRFPITKRVHRLIADTFYDGNHDGLDVNHIDGNKTNNSLDNLEFCTRHHNVQHAFDTGLKQPSRQMKVRVIETGEVFNSIRECGRVLRCNQSDIVKCLSGKSKTCGGYHYEKA